MVRFFQRRAQQRGPRLLEFDSGPLAHSPVQPDAGEDQPAAQGGVAVNAGNRRADSVGVVDARSEEQSHHGRDQRDNDTYAGHAVGAQDEAGNRRGDASN